LVFRGLAAFALINAAIFFAWAPFDETNGEIVYLSQNEKLDPEEHRIADYTYWLTAFTGVLGVVSIVQIFFLIRSDRTAASAAKAATRSADALYGSERGIIIEAVHSLEVDRTYWAAFYDKSPTMPPALVEFKVKIDLKNYGRTPAILRSVRYVIVICGAVPIKEKHNYVDQIIDNPTLGQDIVRSTIYSERTIGVDWTLSTELAEGMQHIYICGVIEYSTVFDSYWRRFFIWKYNRPSNVCTIVHERTERYK
jgi:hypothetical protein